MKNLIRSITACITACILFSACSQKLSLKKRHYRNGYYVSHTKKNHSLIGNNTDKSVTKHSEVVLKEEAPKIAQTDLKQKNKSASETPKNNVSSLKLKSKRYEGPQKALENTDNNLASSVKEIMRSKKVIRNLQINTSKPLIEAGDDDGDGYSLLWLLIIILFVLWILGFAGGYIFGGLVHLILVVAVILFILWLLRLI